jgi:hypothetical protein
MLHYYNVSVETNSGATWIHEATVALGFDTLPGLAGGVSETLYVADEGTGLFKFRRSSSIFEDPEIFVNGKSYGKGYWSKHPDYHRVYVRGVNIDKPARK